ncbi:MAG TPA: universal stress protein [Kofleriaceae bacterium]|nr:universal stress protein [Kofleriaceae bacterium]
MKNEASKVVVGVDFSHESEIAARQALAICRRSGRELVLVYADAVVEIPPVSNSPSPAVREAADTYRAQLARALESIRDRLGELRERLSNQGVTVSQVIVEDSPAVGICTVAAEVQARLTVIGAHGGGGLPWLPVGNVATGVVRLCETDVLVARGSRTERDDYHRIAVGSDFSSSAERALESAVELASPGAQVDVIYCASLRPAVFSGFGVVEPLPAPMRQAIIDDLQLQGEQLLARHRRSGVSLAFHVSPDRPVPGLSHWADSRSCELLAVGSHGRRGVKRLVLGSVAESMLKRAPCSVLVAHGLPATARP